MSKKAVILISGGLDSATVLAIARAQGYQCYALSFSYGQRHSSELAAAKRVVDTQGVAEYRVANIDLAAFGGSALTDTNLSVPEEEQDGIPITYVPARNTIFLSYALAWAEVLQAEAIFIGVNSVDYSGYPDCRPAFIEAFEKMANLATKMGVEEHNLRIETPLMHWSKAQIIQHGMALGVDYALTVSCYQADEQGRACGKCDSCRLRKQGFLQAGVADPTLYVASV
jgi:7-cyano-7-deazaguanine synthase